MSNAQLKNIVMFIYNSINHSGDEFGDDVSSTKSFIEDWVLSASENFKDKEDIFEVSPGVLLRRFKLECTCDTCKKIDTQCSCK